MITNSRKRFAKAPLPIRVKKRDESTITITEQAGPWKPYPGRPQEMAYHSPADVLGYGGEAGGGKSDLLLGLPGNEHHEAVIFRREFPRARGLIQRSREIFNAAGRAHNKDRFNESLHVWRLGNNMLEFASMQYEDDKFDHQGRPRDFYGFDEATEFSETQVRFVIGWNRSTWINPKTGKPQRCRVVLTFNPPMTTEGEWIVNFFLPWLAFLHPDLYQHPNPARPGELRWFSTVAGKDEEIAESELRWFAEEGKRYWEVKNGEPFMRAAGWIVPVRGLVRKDAETGADVLVRCKSRTFIPASLEDNPILQATGYAATVDAMPEPYRSLLKGNWGAGRIVDPWQVIPTAWVRAAEERWRKQEQPNTPLTAVGADIARGGRDRFSIAKLYGTWLAPLEVHAGAVVEDGPKGAALLIPYARPGVPLGVDIISIGTSVYDSLRANNIAVNGINFAEGAGELTDRSKRLKFRNKRAAAYWKLREALDPEHGDGLALPDDSELREELTAMHFTVTASGIQIEDKKDITARLGRSPDKADSLALAYFALTTQPIIAKPRAGTQSMRG